MLMSLTWEEGLDRFTSKGRQWRQALISRCRLAFTESPRQSIQLLHGTAEDASKGVHKKKKRGKKTWTVSKKRNDSGLAHSSLSGPAYLPLCHWAHHISSLNSPIKRRSFDFSSFSFLFLGILLLSASLEDIRVYHWQCWAAASDLQISCTLRILLDREPLKVIGFPPSYLHLCFTLRPL